MISISKRPNEPGVHFHFEICVGSSVLGEEERGVKRRARVQGEDYFVGCGMAGAWLVRACGRCQCFTPNAYGARNEVTAADKKLISR